MEIGFSTAILLVSISMFTAMASFFFVARFGQPGRAASPRDTVLDAPDNIVFLFAGTTLVDATPAALLFVGVPVDRNAVWQKLKVLLSIDFPNADACLRGLLEDETAFELAGKDKSQLCGSVENGQLKIALQTIETKHHKSSIERSALEKQFQELALMRDVVEHSPMLVWRTNLEGKICWANRTYFDLLSQTGSQASELMPPYRPLFTHENIKHSGHNRLSLTLPDQEKPAWFDVLAVRQASGETLYFAMNADPVVQAEDALRNFVQTLTKTFAHLTTGLAIFDRDRHLALFNPALSDLTTLEPSWLTARPTLKAFLDRLRECRHIPEPKDYKSWRDRIAAVEKAAEDGTYEENWPLPTGQTYRVTGRPHPEGAVAFLFEDITSSISLQRKFRAEIDLSQAVLDGLSDAIAVFSASGELVMSNDTFAEVWGFDPREMLARMTFEQAIEAWRETCEPSPVWDRITQGALDQKRRKPIAVEVTKRNGENLLIKFKPLSVGATLIQASQHKETTLSSEPKTLIKVAT